MPESPLTTSTPVVDAKECWVEIDDPQTHQTFYANTISGDCVWDKPPNVEIRARNPEGEWWELFDENHKLPYYYNTKSGATEWTRPESGTIISLVALQKLSLSRQPSTASRATPSVRQESTLHNTEERTASDERPLTPEPARLQDRPDYDSLASSTMLDAQQSTNSIAAAKHSPVPLHDTALKNACKPSVSSNLSPVQHIVQQSQIESSASPQSIRSLPPELMSEIVQFKIEGFASRFFSTHKKGIFRKKIPVEKMIRFSKDSINQPLLLLPKVVHKDAIRTFKLVQRVMGERPNSRTKTNADDIKEILKVGISRGELRDEIYCQVCKQLTQNPKIESVYKGWELMSSLVMAFPPSKNFEAYLQSFMKGHSGSDEEKIKVFAKYCLQKLDRICQKGPRGKVPTIEEIDRSKEAPFNPSVFGESLAIIMANQAKKIPGLKVPYLIVFLADSILKLNGCKTEGIFRVPGDADDVTSLRLRLERNQYDISGITDASVPASLFKLWFRELPDPIITTNLYDFCIHNADNPAETLSVMNKIPELNRNVLSYLVHFLQVISQPENQEFTRMTVNNIAMVFAPNILRCPSDNLQMVLENTKFEQAFVRTLILNLKTNAMNEWKA